jgi:hypothetical protein
MPKKNDGVERAAGDHTIKRKPYATLHGELANVTKQRGKELAEIINLRWVKQLSYPQISRVLGVPEDTIRNLVKPFNGILDNPEAVHQYRKNEEHLLDGAKMMLVQGIMEQMSDPERRKSLDLSRLTYGFGILFDKNRLVKGETTANVQMTLADMVRNAHKPAIDVTPEDAEEVKDGD